MTEFSSISVILLAVAIEVYSAYRSHQVRLLESRKVHEDEAQDEEQGGGDEEEEDGEYSSSSVATLSGATLYLIPVMASISLLLMYFFPSTMGFLMSLLLILSSAQSLVFLFSTSHLIPSSSGSSSSSRSSSSSCSWSLPTLRHHKVLRTILFYLIAAAALLAWLMTGSALLNNLFASALCITFLVFVRLPNAKAASILLSLLFVYDIFWVFYSSSLFSPSGSKGPSVMEKVATTPTVNPVHVVAHAIGVTAPAKAFTLHLQLPVKLVWDRVILGLGDIAIPGLLLCFFFHWDASSLVLKSQQQQQQQQALGTTTASSWKQKVSFWARSYMFIATVCYAVALICAMWASRTFNHGQPALLYIVPLVLGVPLMVAKARGQFHQLWSPSSGDLLSSNNNMTMSHRHHPRSPHTAIVNTAIPEVIIDGNYRSSSSVTSQPSITEVAPLKDRQL